MSFGLECTSTLAHGIWLRSPKNLFGSTAPKPFSDTPQAKVSSFGRHNVPIVSMTSGTTLFLQILVVLFGPNSNGCSSAATDAKGRVDSTDYAGTSESS